MTCEGCLVCMWRLCATCFGDEPASDELADTLLAPSPYARELETPLPLEQDQAAPLVANAEPESPAGSGQAAPLAANAEPESPAPAGSGQAAPLAANAEPESPAGSGQAAPLAANAEPESPAGSDQATPLATTAEQAAGKFWRRRYDLFSRFDEGLLLDSVDWFSVTPEQIATRIAERCACDVVLDAFSGIGGNTIQFARTCRRVLAVEIDQPRLLRSRHNAQVYGVSHRIEWIHADVTTVLHALRADVVFLSPPWGGLGYKAAAIDLRALGGFDCHALVQAVLYLPRYTPGKAIQALAACHAEERNQPTTDCEIEPCVDVFGKVRAVAVYLGFSGAAGSGASAATTSVPLAVTSAALACAIEECLIQSGNSGVALTQLGALLIQRGKNRGAAKKAGGLKKFLQSLPDRFIVEGDGQAETVRSTKRIRDD